MHAMTEQEMLLAERAADTLVDLIRSLESRDPNHPEIAALNRLYGEILHAAVRCIPKVQVEEVREIEWKFGPGNVPKSPVIREIADSNGTPVIELPAHKDEGVRHA